MLVEVHRTDCACVLKGRNNPLTARGPGERLHRGTVKNRDVLETCVVGLRVTTQSALDLIQHSERFEK